MDRIAIISTNKAAWSETFIQAQVERLPAEVEFLYGGWLPRYYGKDQHFLGESEIKQGVIYWGEKMFGKDGYESLRNKITQHLRSKGIKAVLAQYGPSGVEMLPICKDLGIPLIVHFHGYDAFDQEMLAEWGSRYPDLFAGAAAIIGVSRQMVDQLISLGADPAKVHYNPCGANEAHFQYHDAGQNPPRLLAVGRFSETKRHDLTIRAFGKITEEVPEAKLRIAGEGLLFDRCKALVLELGLEQRVSFLGVLDHLQVATEMAQARAFVQHSMVTPSGDSEGTPVAVMEAGLAGLPVVSTQHAGIGEVVLDGKTGLLVAEGDVEGMAQNMLKVLKEPGLATELGEQANAHIKANYTLEKRIAVLWEIIRSTYS